MLTKRAHLRWKATVIFGAGLGAFPVPGGAKIVWPTANTAFLENKPPPAFIQPTRTGKPDSGLFGCFRNAGTRFHEGIDLKAIAHDGKGEAADPVFAVMDGTIAYLNDKPERSNYGRYVVVEHGENNQSIYSLYAHLKSISSGIRVGERVGAGDRLGVMGRSAGGYAIPRKRSHLHFEMGLRLSDHFQSWYDSKSFEEPNFHGLWNGMNLLGFDPLDFFRKFRKGEVKTPGAYISRLPTAFVLRYGTEKIPDFIRRYPFLLTESLPAKGIEGWEIEWTRFGLPKGWTPLLRGGPASSLEEGKITLLKVNDSEVKKGNCRRTLEGDAGTYRIGEDTRALLRIIFQF